MGGISDKDERWPVCARSSFCVWNVLDCFWIELDCVWIAFGLWLFWVVRVCFVFGLRMDCVGLRLNCVGLCLFCFWFVSVLCWFMLVSVCFEFTQTNCGYICDIICSYLFLFSWIIPFPGSLRFLTEGNRFNMTFFACHDISMYPVFQHAVFRLFKRLSENSR